MGNQYWMKLNLYWLVVFASLYAGYKAFSWWQTILVLAAIQVGLFYVINPKSAEKTLKDGSVVVTLPILIVFGSLFVAVFFGIGRVVGQII